MRQAVVIGASGGIGAALTRALRLRGDQVVGLSRRHDGLDITREETVRRHLEGLSDIDLLIVATGALQGAGQPPEKTLRALEPAALADQFALNAIGPALVLKHALPRLTRERPAHVAVLSARVGSIGDNRLGGWYSYRAAKAAVNQIVHTAAIELARTHPQAVCVSLHPGTVETAFTQGYRAPKVTPDAAAANLLSVLEGLAPADSGGFFDWAGKPVPW